MIRTILNDLPAWLVFVLFVGIVTAATVGASLWVRSSMDHWRKHEHAGVVSTVALMVMTLFALVLAFTAVNLYQAYQSASSNVAAEANTLAQIVRDARVFPHDDSHRIAVAVASYDREVHDVEFPELRKGAQDTQAGQDLNEVFNSLQAYSPQTQAQVSFYDSAVNQANSLITERRNRLVSAESSVPSPFVVLLVLTAVLSIVSILFFRIEHRGLEVLLIGTVGIVISAGLLVTVFLASPFSGSTGISPAPYVEGNLATLLKAIPSGSTASSGTTSPGGSTDTGSPSTSLPGVGAGTGAGAGGGMVPGSGPGGTPSGGLGSPGSGSRVPGSGARAPGGGFGSNGGVPGG